MALNKAIAFTSRLPILAVLLGGVFLALSLTPSLLPRSFVLQGVLSGSAFAAGYGVGVLLTWLWTLMELPSPDASLSKWLKLIGGAVCLSMIVWSFWQAPLWQNSVRSVMGMPPVESGHTLRITAVAFVPALILIGLGTLLTNAIRWVTRSLAKFLPRRVAAVGGVILIGVVVALLVNGVLLRVALRAADNFYSELDALAGQYENPPTNPNHSGSPASMIHWDTIGRDARVYVRSGPTAAEITALTGKAAQEPLRVYVGLRSADTLEQRIDLAMDEMIRIGAFNRSVLVLVMPVGTGWVDPPAIDTLEILHGGDVASVAVQYSYLTSWISLVSEPEVGTATAQALFSAVYNHWTNLPAGSRPRLYLHGLSLGAYASQESLLIYDVLADPIQGALWVGPPFSSRQWRSATDNRIDSTPYWLPQVGNSSTIRFTTQQNALDIPGASWGPIRVVYLQYPSDPIVFFEPAVLYRAPAWLTDRAPDVTPDLRWFPVVTFLQLTLDMALAQTVPVGFGHVYAPQDYFDAWVAVTEPTGWKDTDLAVLRGRLTRVGGGVETIMGGWFRADGSLSP